jgi:hypothetical protein
LVAESTAVVHTLGILLEDAGYKKAVRGGSIFGVGQAVLGGLFGTPSPLRSDKEKRTGYDGMNRDSGELEEPMGLGLRLTCCSTYCTGYISVLVAFLVDIARLSFDVHSPASALVRLCLSCRLLPTAYTPPIHRQQARGRSRHTGEMYKLPC